MAKAKDWIAAARLRTLPLSLSGILVGTALASQEVTLNYPIAGLTLLTAFLLQVLSNFANDYGDAVSGVDSQERKGPKRMVQSGTISKVQMRKALMIVSMFTLVSGLVLLYLSLKEDMIYALLFFLLGLVAMVAAIKYTVGKNPYGYAGYGDLFVFLFFGWIAVSGTFFLQTHVINKLVFMPASTIGLLGVGVLNINNIRDLTSDQKAGKNSIPVRIGRRNALIYHAVLLTLAMVVIVLYAIISHFSSFQYLFVASYFLIIQNILLVKRLPAHKLDPILKHLSLGTLLFSFLLAIGLYLE